MLDDASMLEGGTRHKEPTDARHPPQPCRPLRPRRRGHPRVLRAGARLRDADPHARARRRSSRPRAPPTTTTSACSRSGRAPVRAAPDAARWASTTWPGRSTPSTELERLQGVLAERGALVGASDHVTTKSLYAKDPDGIEFEVCWILPADVVTAGAEGRGAGRSAAPSPRHRGGEGPVRRADTRWHRGVDPGRRATAPDRPGRRPTWAAWPIRCGGLSADLLDVESIERQTTVAALPAPSRAPGARPGSPSSGSSRRCGTRRPSGPSTRRSARWCSSSPGPSPG